MLVTGASSGIGAAIAVRLVQDGAQVVGVSRSGQAPAGVTGLVADLCDPGDLDLVVERAATEMNGLDVVVNNAGTARWRPVNEIDRDFFDDIVALNLWAPLRVCQLAYPYLANATDGLVINIGSVDAIRPSAGAGVYGATKAALSALGVALAKEWRNDAIRVVQVDPGLIDTPLASEAVATSPPSVNLAQRAGRPLEVAGLVAYLASPEGRFVNATTIRVDGGALALGPFDVASSSP